MRNSSDISPVALLLLLPLFGACSADKPAVVGDDGAPAVSFRETLSRTGRTLEIDGKKFDVQKIYVQQRLIFCFTPPPPAKPYELTDGNSLLVGRLEVRVSRIEPGVYRLDGDGTLHSLAQGSRAAIVAWNDTEAWLPPIPAKFDTADGFPDFDE